MWISIFYCFGVILNLFEEIESKVLGMLDPGSDILAMMSLPNDIVDAKSRFAAHR